MKKIIAGLFAVAIVLLNKGVAVAAEAAATSGGDTPLITAAIVLGSAVAVGLGAIGPGAGMGSAVRGMIEGIARNPGAANKFTMPFFIGLALMEALALFALLISLVLLFVIGPNYGL